LDETHRHPPGLLAATNELQRNPALSAARKGVSIVHCKIQESSSLYVSGKTPISDLPSFGRLALLFSKLEIHKGTREGFIRCQFSVALRNQHLSILKRPRSQETIRKMVHGLQTRTFI